VLDWHVREQVVFNRKIVECVDAAIEALNENNRAISELAGHWAQLRLAWDHRLEQSEIQFLRSVADLQAAFQHTTRTQHGEFTAALQKAVEKMRLDSDRLIHSELRLIRQRLALESPATPASAAEIAAPKAEPSAAFDYGRFAERFRGNEEYVKAGQRIYFDDFAGRRNVLDIGCGRGEFLEMMREAAVPARGIDLSAESVALCRQKGLAAEVADLFAFLARQPEAAFDGIFCSQVVEHLPPERLPEMIKLAASRLAPGGVIAIETPNPECLAIFATHFYLDPTHTRPIPHPLLLFYLEEFGVGGIEVRRLSPAVETMPGLAALPADFREAFFGGLDYAVVGRKL
jgi:O-antigen chain-terminating methyltransferase